MDIEVDGELRRLFSPKITQLHAKVRDAQASLATQIVAELSRRIGDLEMANESLHRDVAALEAFLAEQGTVEREVWERWCSEWKEDAARLVADSELVEEFFRTDRKGGETRILVRTISWRGPHTPISKWVQGATLPEDASKVHVERGIQALLRDPRFFAICEECSERNPVGWMHSEHICQDCASGNHGVVY